MSSTNKTTYYELPQFVDNDIFNPLVDDNDAYSKIDTALHNIAGAEADDASEIVDIKSRLDSAEGDIDALEAQNGNSVLTTTAQTLSGAVNELDADTSALDGRLDIVEDDINNVSTGLKAKVTALETQNGSEHLNTTAQTLSGGVNEILLKLMSGFVTPEMYGAVGDGVTDDTTALTNALQSDSNVVFGANKTYLISSHIILTKGNKVVIGNNSTITSNTEIELLVLNHTVEDIEFISVNFIGTLPTSVAFATVVLQSTGTDIGINGACKKIHFDGCTFAGGVHELTLNSSTNVVIENCIFKNTQGITDVINSGYCILLQSAYNTTIRNCLFTEQKKVRHAIYISVDQRKTSNIKCVNTIIEGNYFDDSEQEYASGNTSAINVRASDNTVIKNNYFYQCVGMSVNPEDGDIDILIDNNTFDGTVYRSATDAPSECRNSINLLNDATYKIFAKIINNKEVNITQTTGFFIHTAPNCIGDVMHNYTASNKFILISGKMIFDYNKSNGNGALYRLNTVDGFDGYVGNHNQNDGTPTYNISFSDLSVPPISLKNLSDDYVRFSVAGSVCTPDNQFYANKFFTKNADNTYSLTLEWCKDSDCMIIPEVSEMLLNIKKLPTTQSANGGMIVNFALYDNNDTLLTGLYKFGFKLQYKA